MPARVDRRTFLASAVAVPFAAIRGAAPSIFDRGFARVTKFADGVYVTLANPAGGPGCLSNGGVIAGRDAALLVEGHFRPEGALLEIEVARTVSGRPIMGAVNTHFHLDHTFGNSGYARSGVPIVAHERTSALMKTEYGSLRGKDRRGLLEPLERRIASAPTAGDRVHAESDLAAARWMYGAIEAADLAYPTELLATRDFPKAFDLGGLTAVLDYVPGHTLTDIIVRVPDRDVVFAGDLLFSREYPVAISADMRKWRAALDRLRRLGARIRFVPGHGGVCGQDTVSAQIDLVDDLHRHAERMIRAGATLEEAERRYQVPGAFKSYDVFSWGWTIGAAMRSYYSTR